MHLPLLVVLVLASFAVLGGHALSASSGNNDVLIENASGLIQFSNSIKSGTAYSGTTVYLTADIEFTEELSAQFYPIGNDASYYFRGAFDGQGHTIRNLAINSTNKYAGLFGYSKGLTIRNVVLDSSCSLTHNRVEYTYSYTGWIIGYLDSYDKGCLFENNVNMANITIKANNANAFVGGIIGYSYLDYYKIEIKNCANYGNIYLNPGMAECYAGGIAGYLSKRYSQLSTITNSVNHGDIQYNGAYTTLYIGGITGYADADIKNCVNTGTLTPYLTSRTGSIVGYLYSGSSIENCYWEKSTGTYCAGYIYGKSSIAESTLFDGTTFETNQSVSVGSYTGTSLIHALNVFSSETCYLCGYSGWVLNRNSAEVTFNVANVPASVTMNSRVILMPALAREGFTVFDGWYEDKNCTTAFSGFEISDNMTLYGKWEEDLNSYTVTFDTRGGSSVDPITAQCFTSVSLPYDVKKKSCELGGWETEYGEAVQKTFTVPARNITLYAKWPCDYINSAEELIELANNVNKGKIDYSGTTVYLAADIEFTEELSAQFYPIGNGTRNYFKGTFDGQGHTIRNLAINSTNEYTGLFGYSNGLTIRNAVLDSSCSLIYNKGEYTNSYAGGIICYLYSGSKRCLFENNVNMANITIKANNANAFVGGIIGYSYLDYDDLEVINCANYGNIYLNPGMAECYAGGIAGYLTIFYLYTNKITNSVNHGDIQHIGKYTTLYIGGIAGYVYYADIKNCVNTGTLTPYLTSRTGSIVGYLYSGSSIENCYWEKSTGTYCAGYAYSKSSIAESTLFDGTTFETNQSVSVGSYTGTSLIRALNTFSSETCYLCGYSGWVLNRNSAEVTFNVPASVTMNSRVILTPALAREGFTVFDGWYEDKNCTTAFSGFEISDSMTLYGKWEEDLNSYTVTFDTRGGSSVDPITAQCFTSVSLPYDVKKKSCELNGWETEYGEAVQKTFTVPARNITLYAKWFCDYISSAEELIELANKVNNRKKNYSETTVYLAADIEFTKKLSAQFYPIGNGTNYYFKGTFDGQGHTIRNLVINSTNEYTGLFGYSKGLTIRNVVLDSSCSLTHNRDEYSGSYTGGIIGYLYSYNKKCLLENNVNMASILLKYVSTSYSSYNYYAGGFIGSLDADYNVTVRNCLNYGNFNHSKDMNYIYEGGVVGYLKNYYEKRWVNITNCANYGSIGYRQSGYGCYFGGIVGYVGGYYGIENCLSMGPISTISYYSGSITGYAWYSNPVLHCFWTAETGVKDAVGNVEYLVNSSSIKVNAASVKALDDYAIKNRWNRWIYNKNNGNVTFTVNKNGSGGWTFAKSGIVMRMDPVDADNAFSGWFTDSSYRTHFTSSEISGSQTKLYGQWCDIRVIFDAGEVVVYPKHKGIIYGSTYGELPAPEKIGHTLFGWNTTNGLITSETVVTINETHTAYAVWLINNYTLTFDLKNGTKIASIFQYDETVVYPEDPVKEGYTFKKWKPYITKMPAYNMTITAVWKKNTLPYQVVLCIVFSVIVSAGAIAVIFVVFFVRKCRNDDDNDDNAGAETSVKTSLMQFAENNSEVL